MMMLLFSAVVKDFPFKPINGYDDLLIQETIASLNHKRHSCLAAAIGDNLLVLGGYKGQGLRSSDIELYV